MIVAPPDTYVLPEWPPHELARWDALAQRAFEIATRAGTGARFRRTVDEVRRLVAEGQLDELDRRLGDHRFARALLTVWHDDEQVARASLTRDRLSALTGQSRLTRLTTVSLIAVLLKYFDMLDTWEPGFLAAVGAATLQAVERQSVRHARGDVVETFRRDHHYMVRAEGPANLVEALATQDVALDDYIRRTGLLGFAKGRFGDRLRHAYYIAQIRAADHTLSGHGFLGELALQTVLETPGRDGLHFGHEVLEALTDKPADPPSDEWLGTILDIAGDPRLKNTPRWRKWWEPVSERARDQVIRWLSAEDLRLFLLAVENFGRDASVEDLARLFPPRKKFLWGLYDSGRVHETRLILGRNVRGSVQEQVTRVRTDVALYRDGHDTAIIYVDCGDFHLVEGSHNFRLWVYAGRPVPMLTDRTKRSFTRQDLIYDVKDQHAEQHPDGYLAHIDVRHKGFWQRRPLEFLIEDYGIDLDPEQLLTAEDYDKLKYVHGLPILGSARS